MNYLVIGDSNSMHIYNFVKTVLLPRQYNVFLLTLSRRPIKNEYQSFYEENNVRLYSISKGKNESDRKISVFGRIKEFFQKINLIKKIPDIDICHVQSVYKTSILMILLNRKKFKKVILSYWGGDIEDKSRFVIVIRKICFKYANAITLTTKEMLNQFHSINGHCFDNKLYICRFATDGVTCIHELSKKTTKSICRKNYGLPNNKIIVTCGYSAYKAQHQDRILTILNSLDEKYKKDIFVIIPMQYGRFDLDYIQSVKSSAKACSFDYMILEEYVSFQKSAELAILTDIYIHLRDTDAFSNALKEHVYSCSKVIKGDWLKYPELDEMGADVISISCFEDLKETIINILDNYCETEAIKLFEPIYSLYSTKSIVEQWGLILSRICEDEFNDKK